jgi:hypothetical protein
MAITLNDNLQIQANKNIDNRYGPYVSLAAALAGIATFQRSRGLTIGIIEAGLLKEYWFKDGVADINLVEKKTASGEGARSNLIYKIEYDGSSGIYIGTAPTGSSESSNVWTIKKSIFSLAGTFISNVSGLNMAWNNKYTL